MSGLILSAPSSGSGKTTVTLGLLRALRRRDLSVKPGKAGPDYIDPAYHAIASGVECLNFDPWAMRPDLLEAQAASDERLVIEAMMGLYDGAADNTGSAASLAKQLDLSVVMVIDCGRLSQSVGAILRGYVDFDPGVRIAGVILNKVGSPRHEAMLRAGLAGIDVPIVGIIPRDRLLALPERHLGLVLAGEINGLETFIEHAADVVEAHCDVLALAGLAERHGTARNPVKARIPPLGGRIAVARDAAFAFIYPHLLEGWREQGAEITFFSPLDDDTPEIFADAVFLPGGYPELHAERLSNANHFRETMRTRASSGMPVYGECGGYMALGETLIDGDGLAWPMLGLLPLSTSFADRKRHLGYRHLIARAGPFAGLALTAHEFHYTAILREGGADRLFDAVDATGATLPPAGLVAGSVSGSFMHLIDLDGTRG